MLEENTQMKFLVWPHGLVVDGKYEPTKTQKESNSVIDTSGNTRAVYKPNQAFRL